MIPATPAGRERLLHVARETARPHQAVHLAHGLAWSRHVARRLARHFGAATAVIPGRIVLTGAGRCERRLRRRQRQDGHRQAGRETENDTFATAAWSTLPRHRVSSIV